MDAKLLAARRDNRITVYKVVEKGLVLYVGITSQPQHRRLDHRRTYPTATFTPLAVTTLDDARRIETELIKKWSPRDNNPHMGGHGPIEAHRRKAISKALTGRTRSRETRRKISDTMKGRPRPKLSQETIEKVRVAALKREAKKRGETWTP